jgi:SAM-dependent methyltransferase
VPDQTFTVSEVSEFLDGSSLEVAEEIASDDPMFHYAPRLYFQAGQEALRNVRLAMLAARKEEVTSLLDFACGRGRVLRMFQAAFPDADITGSDIEPPAVDFVRETFGVTGIVSDYHPDKVELPGTYDVIWCGSLLTHVDAERFTGFMKLFESVLAPGGVAVFTVYGRFIADGLRDRSVTLDLTEEQADIVLCDYDKTGFGFYPGLAPEINFGDCVATRSWVCEQLDQTPNLKLLLYIEEGWLGQDVVACTTVQAPNGAT